MSSGGASKDRTFTVEQYSFGKVVKHDYDGKFTADGHRSAASKAASKLFAASGRTTGTLIVVMRETTRDSNKSTRKYKVTRKSDPKTVMINGKQVTYKYSNKIEAMN